MTPKDEQMRAMDFAALLVAWFAGWDQGSSALRLELHQGPTNRDKRAAWLGAESSQTLGSLTVWDTGELEVEVVDVQSETRIRVVSGVVTTADDLHGQLARFIEAAQPQP